MSERAPIDRVLRGPMPVLDAIRGLAMTLVLADRFNVDADTQSWIGRAVSRLMELGWVGVQLFFVLSGFLITGILLESRGTPHAARAFYARRVLRIFPIYYVTLAVAFLVVPHLIGRPLRGSEHQIWLWTYLANWTIPLGLGVHVFSHCWSLAVEEQFYLVWPFVVRWMSLRGFAAVCLVLAATAPLIRFALRAQGAPAEAVYMFTVCRVDALALGAIAALALREPVVSAALAAGQQRIVLATVGLFFAGGLFTRGYPRLGLATQTLGYSVLAWGSVVLVVVAVLAQARRPALAALLSPKILRIVGKYSYAMYIFHPLVHHGVGVPLLAHLGQSRPDAATTVVYFLAMSGLTFGLAFGSYHLLEKHFLLLKRRFPM